MTRSGGWMLMALAALIAPGPARADEEIVEEILAKVNDEIITRSELMEKLDPYRAELQQRLSPEEVAARLRELESRLLEDEIVRRLILDRARKRGIVVPQEAIDRAIARIKEENQIADDERFERTLQEMGSSRAKLTEMLRQDYLVNQVIQFEVMGGVVVSESELQQYYQDHPAEFEVPERVRLRQIFIAGVNEGSRLTAEELRDRLRQGSDFQQLASQYSDAPSRDKGGDEGLFERGELDPALEAAAFGLTVGSVSEVIATKNGYHILWVVDRSGGGQRSFDDAKQEIQRKVQELKLEKARKEYVEKLKRENYVEVLGSIKLAAR